MEGEIEEEGEDEGEDDEEGEREMGRDEKGEKLFFWMTKFKRKTWISHTIIPLNMKNKKLDMNIIQPTFRWMIKPTRNDPENKY